MKKLTVFVRLALPMIFLFAFVPNTSAQLLKNLGKRAERAAERAVERRVDQEATEKTDQVLDSILEPGSNEKPTKTPAPQKETKNNKSQNEAGVASKTDEPSPVAKNEAPKSIKVYSKFDFVPGDKPLFFDDFADDFIGDFPSKWNTNGNGEVVTTGEPSEKWFELKSKSAYYPNVADLPEDFTVEFDFMLLGVDNNTSSTAKLILNLRDDNSFDWYETDKNSVTVSIPLCQYIDADIRVKNNINGASIINNLVETDIRKVILSKPHVSVAVNGTRFRLWVNETKYLDLPKLAPNDLMNYVRFDLEGLEDGKDRLFLKNLKIAGGGVDLRRQLIAEGKVSTNGILFDSGSANIQPQSMGIILQISQVLQQEANMKLKIVGHTDADGSDTANIELSKKRAEAIKEALISIYNVSSNRLVTEGKGESEPVGDNSTPNGKAQNRRVEFIKQ